VLPSSHYINKQEALFKFPMLNPDGLKGALAVSCVDMQRLLSQSSVERCSEPSKPALVWCLYRCANPCVCIPRSEHHYFLALPFATSAVFMLLQVRLCTMMACTTTRA
jgi:hypothetical protein